MPGRRMAVKVDNLPVSGDMSIRFPAMTLENALEVIVNIRENPPEGYKLIESRVKPRGKSGRRCNVRLTFQYIDDRIPKLASGGAKNE